MAHVIVRVVSYRELKQRTFNRRSKCRMLNSVIDANTCLQLLRVIAYFELA
jgi:hypothetical protein